MSDIYCKTCSQLIHPDDKRYVLTDGRHAHMGCYNNTGYNNTEDKFDASFKQSKAPQMPRTAFEVRAMADDAHEKITNCPCQRWAYTDTFPSLIPSHHPRCDGSGVWPARKEKEVARSEPFLASFHPDTVIIHENELKPSEWKCGDCGQQIIPPHKCPELSILVIDLGDSCVVKIETPALFGRPLDNPVLTRLSLDSGLYWQDKVTGIAARPIAELRQLIDEVGMTDKPVPRIERNAEDHVTFTFYRAAADPRYFGPLDIADLETIIGGKIPIYEPKQGTWTQLYPWGGQDVDISVTTHDECNKFDLQRTAENTARTITEMVNGVLPFKVWRHTR